MFVLTDTDHSGTIAKEEFAILSKRMGMNLSSHRINEIFANLKKGEDINNNTNTIN